MCFTTAGDPPTIFRAKIVRARKEHRCHECGRPILPGRKYESVFGVWEGNPATFRTCLLCADLRGCVMRAERDAGCDPEDSAPGFGLLLQALREKGEDGDGNYPDVPQVLGGMCPTLALSDD